jgi:hypothetical protein
LVCANASTIAPSAAVISSAEVSSKANRYWVKISAPRPVTLPPAPASAGGEQRAADRPDQQHGEREPDDHGGQPLPAQHLDHRVGAVAAHQHQHEQEQHHHGAGVDDDLHESEERRVLDHVEHGEREHRAGQAQRRVDGVAGEHHAQRAEQRDGTHDPERDGLAEADDLSGGRLGKQLDRHLTCSPTGSDGCPAFASVGPCT